MIIYHLVLLFLKIRYEIFCVKVKFLMYIKINYIRQHYLLY